MLSTGFHYNGPAAIRYPRGTGPGAKMVEALETFPIGKAEVRRRGHHGLAILSFGTMLAPAAVIAAETDATLVNMRFVKSLDEELILEMARTHQAFVTIEDNAIAGGAGAGGGVACRQWCHPADPALGSTGHLSGTRQSRGSADHGRSRPAADPQRDPGAVSAVRGWGCCQRGIRLFGADILS
jgi:hypothetical protein